jgi:hypothetical protein
MLNSLSLENYNLGHKTYIEILHVIFILVITILLVNFLVAVMANAHAEITPHEDIIQTLQQLEVALTVEERLNVFCKCFGLKKNREKATNTNHHIKIIRPKF